MILYPNIEFAKATDKLLIRCETCNSEFLRQKRVYKKLPSPDKCRSCSAKRVEQNVCDDCGISVHRGSKRCKKCYGKSKILNRPNCVDCGITLKTVYAKRCLSCHNIKQDNGKSTERVKFNSSKKWHKVRTMCFERDSYTCQKCNKKGGNLNAHHIKTWAKHPSLRLDIDNLLTLCVDCHMKLHGLNKR